jgi:hypothetical protein
VAVLMKDILLLSEEVMLQTRSPSSLHLHLHLHFHFKHWFMGNAIWRATSCRYHSYDVCNSPVNTGVQVVSMHKASV